MRPSGRGSVGGATTRNSDVVREGKKGTRWGDAAVIVYSPNIHPLFCRKLEAGQGTGIVLHRSALPSVHSASVLCSIFIVDEQPRGKSALRLWKVCCSVVSARRKARRYNTDSECAMCADIMDAACSQQTQATVATGTIGIQCALGLLVSASSQTCQGFSGLDVDQASWLVRLPGPRGAANITGPLTCICRTRSGCAGSFSNNGAGIQSGRKLHGSLSCQQHSHQSAHDSASFVCRVCQEVFRLRCCLSTHMRRHTSKPYMCSTCQKCFSQKGDLTNHERVHSGERPFVCGICQKSFTRRSHLVYHHISHSGEKPYVCSVCQKCFSRKGHLTDHKRSHSGEKPYTCGICQKSFSQKGYLVYHERLHSGEKPYVCDICQKSFSQKGHLVSHARSHSGEKPFVCTVCPKRFVLKQSLTRHERVHSGERPFSCPVCQKSFTMKWRLMEHERLHTGERPHMCHVCQGSFIRKEQLIKHERLHVLEGP